MNQYRPDAPRGRSTPQVEQDNGERALHSAMEFSRIPFEQPMVDADVAGVTSTQEYTTIFEYKGVEVSMRVERTIEWSVESKHCYETLKYYFTLPQDDSRLPVQTLHLDVYAEYADERSAGSVKTSIEREGGRSEGVRELPRGLGGAVYNELLTSILPDLAAQYPADIVHSVSEAPFISKSDRPLTHEEWMAIFEPLLRTNGYTLDQTVDGPTIDGKGYEVSTLWSKAYAGRNRGLRDFDRAEFTNAA